MTIAAEPVLVWIETAVLIHAVIRFGRWITRLVFVDSAESVVVKSLIILFTCAIYYFSARILVAGVFAAPSPIFTQ